MTMRKERGEGASCSIGEREGVSFGFMSNRWLEQFEDEVLLAKLPDGGLFVKRGTPLGVELMDEEVARIEGAVLWHTHTTPIGGTFSSDDIALTVRAASPLHIVRATLLDDEYSLRRTRGVTDELAGRFVAAYREKEHAELFEARARIWEAEYERIELPLDRAAERRVDTLVKSTMHEWLIDHAANYGFEYSFKLGEEPQCSK